MLSLTLGRRGDDVQLGGEARSPGQGFATSHTLDDHGALLSIPRGSGSGKKRRRTEPYDRAHSQSQNTHPLPFQISANHGSSVASSNRQRPAYPSRTAVMNMPLRSSTPGCPG